MLQCLRRRRLVYAAAVQRSVYDLSFWTAKEIYEMYILLLQVSGFWENRCSQLSRYKPSLLKSSPAKIFWYKLSVGTRLCQ